MPDMRDELAEIVDDLMAVIADQALRGVVEESVGGAPVKIARRLPMKPSPAVRTPATPTPPSDPTAWTDLATQDRSAAEAPRFGSAGLKAVGDDLGDCRRCALCTQRRNIVFGVGDACADLMIIGGGPGAQEDTRGEPFVGPDRRANSVDGR